MPSWRLITCHHTFGPQPVQKMRRDKKFADARAVMKRIGGRLVQERKLALSEGKDLLSLLVKANMAGPELSSMSDEDVQDRKSSLNSGALTNACRPSHHYLFFFISMQKSLPLSLLVTRLAAQVSPGAFIASLTTPRRRSAYGPRSKISGQIGRVENR